VAAPLAIAGAEPIELAGDTTAAPLDRHGVGPACASGAGAGDHVYRVLPAVSGTLSVSARGAGALRPVLYLRTGCDDAASEVACGSPSDDAARASLTATVRASEPYFLFVDGRDGTYGPYAAVLSLAPASFCGDGRVDPAEACDDGNSIDGDGCAARCQSVDGNPASAGGCPGQPVDVWPGLTVRGVGTTAGYGSVWDAAADRCGSESTPATDHLYAVTPHATGTLSVRVEAGAGHEAALVVGGACGDPAGTLLLACGSAPEAEVTTADGRPVFVAVRGTGSYAIAFAVVADGGL
jgi:cysteine-rich repeat protein